MSDVTGERVTYAAVLGHREFRALYLGGLVSSLGDQLTKVALAILVFNRTGSPLLAALTYALAFLPWVIGGPLLSPLADRLPRRRVMLAGDAIRAVLVALMTIPRMPLFVLFVLLLASTVATPPFDAARAALIPDLLDGEAYVTASALSNITYQLANGAGLLLGGIAVAAFGARGALMLDSGTFVVSGALIWFGVRARPAAAAVEGQLTLVRDMAEGARVVFGAPMLRAILVLAWVGAAFAIVPEGIAVAYAHRFGGGPVATGFLTAAGPVGTMLGMYVFSRHVGPALRLRLMVPMAGVAFVPLLLTVARPGIAVAFVLWLLSGVGLAYQLAANQAFVRAIPDAVRGRGFGLAQAGLQVFQGLALTGAGALALVWHPAAVVATAGLCGLGGVIALAWSWPHEAFDGLLAEPPAPPPATVEPEVGAMLRWVGPLRLVPQRRRELLIRLQRDVVSAPAAEPSPE